MRKQFISKISISIVLISLISCNNTSKKNENLKIEIKQPVDLIKTIPKTDSLKTLNKEKRKIATDISDLLQGKWQHVDDNTNYLVFEGNLRKEIASGMEKWDVEAFVLSNQCDNLTQELKSEEQKYISCIDSNMCWYIVAIDESNLTLSYVGRGNTLSYKRVK